MCCVIGVVGSLMGIYLIPWDKDRLKSLNGEWTTDVRVTSYANKDDVDSEYGIYIMHSKRGVKKIDYEGGTVCARRVFRVGGIGVKRAFGSETGNNARKRLAQCNANQNKNGLKAARNWKYVFGATVQAIPDIAHLAFATAFAESLLQHQFSQNVKFRYLGHSHFNCPTINQVNTEAAAFVERFNKILG